MTRITFFLKDYPHVAAPHRRSSSSSTDSPAGRPVAIAIPSGRWDIFGRWR
ncbi:hypothetical protein LLG96_08235 [bacterium]|nr:hypothetical protein [bacterium]